MPKILTSLKIKSMKTVGVICGGFSSEYDISLKSGTTILENFPAEYKAVRIILSKENTTVEWNGELFPIDLPTLTFQAKDGKHKIDYALIYIHGNPGENGKIQALFDINNIPYINSGALASELSFDKWYCNQFLRNFGIPVAKSCLLLRGESWDAKKIVNNLGLPIFVKPCDSGSSYGISKVKAEEHLNEAIENAFKEGDSVVLESFLNGIEVTCGVYKSKDGLIALPLAEIVSENDFFDFEAKYLGQSQEIVPARIPHETTIKVQEISKKIYSILRLRSVSRVDFMIVDDVPHVIEVNTIPGFTSESIVPRMLKAENKSITDFWKEIMEVEAI